MKWVRERSRGQGLVETAVVLPVLLFMMIGAVEVGWVLRTFLVLQNGNREGTRFAARGKYLDFTLRSFTDVASELSVSGCSDIGDIQQPQCWDIVPQTVGYTYVLSSVMSSISGQVPLHVSDANPNGTIIISYFLVDFPISCGIIPILKVVIMINGLKFKCSN